MGTQTDWAPATIGDLIGHDGVFTDGDWVESKDQDPQGDMRLIQLADIGDGKYVNKSSRFLTSTKAADLNCTTLERGDVLIARMPDPLGRACIFPGDSKRCVTVVDVCVVRPANSVERLWLMHWINATPFRQEISAKQSGSTRKRISRKNLAALEMSVPPAAEQRAIVDKIEALFSELDQGVAQLEAAWAQLKRYRQAVLKAAFEGKLTADWRAEQQKAGNLPTASDLLEQIKSERAGRYEQQLTEWKQAVKDWEAAGGKDSDQKKPRKPVKPKDVTPLTDDELAVLPKLPDGWCWCRLDVVSDVSGGLTKNAKREALPLKLPYLRVANVYSGRLNLSVIKEIGVTEAERDRTNLDDGDLLFVEGNGSADQIGRVAVWDGSISPCLHQNHLIRCRPTLTSTTRFMLHWFLSPDGRGFIMREASSTSGLHTLSISKISALVLPLAPSSEQEEIVNEIDTQLSILDKLADSIEDALAQANALRQSILKKAFEGRLLDDDELAAVRADPAYEPADKLLERIRSKREEAEAKKPTQRRKKKAKAAGGAK